MLPSLLTKPIQLHINSGIGIEKKPQHTHPRHIALHDLSNYIEDIIKNVQSGIFMMDQNESITQQTGFTHNLETNYSMHNITNYTASTIYQHISKAIIK